MLITFCDTLIVGRIGEVELAASALASSITSVLLVFSIGFSFPISSLVAQSVGERDQHKTVQLFKHGMLMCLAIGTIVVLGGLMAMPLLRYLRQPEEVMVILPPFMLQLLLSLLPVMIYQGFRQFIEGLGDTRPAMIAGLLTVGINVGLNYVFIFGYLGFAAQGVVGSGMASHVARWFLALSLGAYILTQPKYRVYWQSFFQTPFRIGVLRELIKFGFPISLQLVFEVAVFSAAAIMIGWISPQALAAHQSVLTLAGLTYMAASGIGTATSIRAGNFFGARDNVQLRLASQTGIRLAATFMAGCSILLIAFHQLIPWLFLHEANSVLIASQLLLVAALFQVADGVQVVLLGALRGINDVKYPTLITLVAYWVVAMPLGYVLAFWFDLAALGVWIGLCLGLFGASITLFFRLKYQLRVLDKRLPSMAPESSATMIAH